MSKTTVELIGTLRFKVRIDEEELIAEAGGLVEVAQWIIGDELCRRFSFEPIIASVESWDHGEVLEYGDYRDPVTCPVCGTPYANKQEINYIERHGACGACPSPELEEWE